MLISCLTGAKFSGGIFFRMYASARIWGYKIERYSGTHAVVIVAVGRDSECVFVSGLATSGTHIALFQ